MKQQQYKQVNEGNEYSEWIYWPNLAIQSTNSPNVPSTTAELTIFNKEGRNVTEKKQNGWEKLAMNDETNEIGTKLKVEKNEDLTALKVNADSGKGNGIKWK